MVWDHISAMVVERAIFVVRDRWNLGRRMLDGGTGNKAKTKKLGETSEQSAVSEMYPSWIEAILYSQPGFYVARE